MKKVFQIIIIVVVLSVVLRPDFVLAQSASLNVGQTVCAVEPCAPGGGSSAPSDTSSPSIFDVAVKAKYNSALISWSTNEISLAKVSWGKNNDYADGEISKEQYSKLQSAEILNLLPETQYFFRIIAFDQAGNDRIYTGKFLTLAEPDTISPANVSQFVVKAAQDRMLISWKNPADSDFETVRIVRSDWFYPLDPFNGEVVFEGRDEFASDGTVFPGKTYYYAAFARDYAGNYSTGALGIGMIVWYSEIPQNQYPDAPVVDINFPIAQEQVKNPANFNDFAIVYNNDGSIVNSNNPQVPAGTDIKLVIPAGKLPEGTKALTLTVKDKDSGEGQVTYLFAFNKLTNEFFVTVPALIVKQAYRLVITIFNGAQQILQTIVGSLEIIRNSANNIVINSSAESSRTAPIFAIIVLLALVLIFYLVRYTNTWQYSHQTNLLASANKPARPTKTVKKPVAIRKKKAS